MRISFPENLPVSEKISDIRSAIETNQVVVVAGETGSGKTTQLPKLGLLMGYGSEQVGRIAHTQPRRIAARTVANRIRQELVEHEPDAHAWVGHKVRFNDTVNRDTKLKLLTDGMLLAEAQHDRLLKQYSLIIIDEAHERSLNIDFLLGFLKCLLPKRPELRVIITSATIDHARFSAHFNDAPVIEVSGRTYPVDIRYHDFSAADSSGNDADGGHAKPDLNVVDGIAGRVLGAVDELLREEPRLSPRPARDILVFLSGERDIRQVAQAARHQFSDRLEVLPLYARLSDKEQNRVFNPGKVRRLVLATNVAETSLTVPNIGYVIDAGYARISRYSARSKLQRLPIEAISQASANQRSGRCGRIGPGVCYRLYSEQDFLGRSEFTEPEILRTHLAAVILQMATLKLGHISNFPFLDQPDARLIKDGYQLLEELGALDERGRISKIGRQLAKIPLDPKFGRILIEANELACYAEALVIVTALSVQDPRDIPAANTDAAKEKHRVWFDKRSEFISYVLLWNDIEEAKAELTRKEFSKWCKKQVLSELRIREWQDLHRQVKLIGKELGYKEATEQQGDYASIHRALLRGLFHHVAERDTATKEKDKLAHYRGIRNRTLSIFPGSALKNKRFSWLLAAEIIETHRVYAHRIAQVEVQWVEQAASHLLKKSHSDPHWEQRRGQVVALEQATLLGLMIYAGRRVHFGPIDAVLAREIFIREALVAQAFKSRAPFLLHNRALREQIEAMEEKRRKRNIMVDDEVLFAFYDERIPADIYQQRSLERWLKRQPDDVLQMTLEDLMLDQASELTSQDYPDVLLVGGQAQPLIYKFTPGEPQDGVTLNLNLALMGQLDQTRLDWLVPGLLPGKIEALIRALPKAVRKNFVPVPNYVNAFLEAYPAPSGSLMQALATFLTRMSGIPLSSDMWSDVALPSCYVMKISVVDEQEKELHVGSDLEQLQKTMAGEMKAAIKKVIQPEEQSQQHTTWPDAMTAWTTTKRVAGQDVPLYHALADQRTYVTIEACVSEGERDQVMMKGLMRLFVLALNDSIKYVKKSYKQRINQVTVSLQSVSQEIGLIDGLIDTSVATLFVDGQRLIFSEAEFVERLSAHKAEFVTKFESMLRLLELIAQQYRQVQRALKKQTQLDRLEAVKDINQQMAVLFSERFLQEAPEQWLQRYPVYLKAIMYRLERLAGQLTRDRGLMLEWQQAFALYERTKARLSLDELGDNDIKWWLQELRVSLFAQQLGTKIPISVKRIEKRVQALLAST